MGSPVRIALVVGATALTAIAACSSFDDANDDGLGPAQVDAGVDATSADGGTVDSGVVNLLTNGDFEMLGCAGWSANYASVKTSTVARTGNGSCKFCSTAGVTYLIGTAAPGAIAPGGRYAASLWLRKDDDADATITTANLQVRTAGDAVLQDGPTSTGPSLDASWSRLDAVIDVTADGGTDLLLLIYGTQVPSCILIDDAVVYRVK